MISKKIMLIAGEPSGDILAAELVQSLRATFLLRDQPGTLECFGAGGPAMAAAGVTLHVDLTKLAIFGVSDLLRHYLAFRKIFYRLINLAVERAPDAIIFVDFSGFNLRFARAIKRRARSRAGPFHNWNPKLIYFVSPQVWASRPGRLRHIGQNIDLLLSIFPFERDWYASRLPHLKVQFVGHPLIDRFAAQLSQSHPKTHSSSIPPPPPGRTLTAPSQSPLLLLLPGSRKRELEAHLPVITQAVHIIRQHCSVRVQMVLPSADLIEFALPRVDPSLGIEMKTKLADSLSEAAVAIASSGTVTMECAYFRVPTVVLYITSWLTYQIGRRLITVPHVAMPNLIAGQHLFPEFIQHAATPDRIAHETLDLLSNQDRRRHIQAALQKVIASLGPPGACQRAAQAIAQTLQPPPPPIVHPLPGAPRL